MSDLLRPEFLAGFPLEASSMARREEYAYRKALHLYHSVRTSAFFHRLWAQVTGNANRLLAIPEVYDIFNRYDMGYLTVEIDKVKGTEGRQNDYDDHFRPIKNNTRERWIRMAMLVWLGVGLPPVELIQVDDVYFIRDGHNRISTMRALKCKYVDAHVVHLETSFSHSHMTQFALTPQQEHVIITL